MAENSNTTAGSQIQQFDPISEKYAAFVATDPFRQWLHYPSVLSELQSGPHTSVLDVGCGDGVFAELLATRLGCRVTGYDAAPRQVEIAVKRGDAAGSSNSYLVATAEKFVSLIPFSSAVSVMVLPYAETRADLAHFFDSTFRALEPGGRFISVVLNPHFKSYDQKIGSRIFSKTTGGKIRINFITPSNETAFTSIASSITEEEYVTAAEQAGFGIQAFRELAPNEDGRKAMGSAFWDACERSQPYSLLVVKRD